MPSTQISPYVFLISAPPSPPLTLDIPVHDAQWVQVLETTEHTQEDVLSVAEDKTSSFTVLFEVKEVVAQGGPLPLLQHALDVTCGCGENSYLLELDHTSKTLIL